ncbi:hypothetical protein V8C86DRAFT_1034528 [Haematococcus lacustris]
MLQSGLESTAAGQSQPIPIPHVDQLTSPQHSLLDALLLEHRPMCGFASQSLRLGTESGDEDAWLRPLASTEMLSVTPPVPPASLTHSLHTPDTGSSRPASPFACQLPLQPSGPAPPGVSPPAQPKSASTSPCLHPYASHPPWPPTTCAPSPLAPAALSPPPPPPPPPPPHHPAAGTQQGLQATAPHGLSMLPAWCLHGSLAHQRSSLAASSSMAGANSAPQPAPPHLPAPAPPPWLLTRQADAGSRLQGAPALVPTPDPCGSPTLSQGSGPARTPLLPRVSEDPLSPRQVMTHLLLQHSYRAPPLHAYGQGQGPAGEGAQGRTSDPPATHSPAAHSRPHPSPPAAATWLDPPSPPPPQPYLFSMPTGSGRLPSLLAPSPSTDLSPRHSLLHLLSFPPPLPPPPALAQGLRGSSSSGGGDRSPLGGPPRAASPPLPPCPWVRTNLLQRMSSSGGSAWPPPLPCP